MVYFQTKKPILGLILEGLVLEDVGRYILWLFGIFYSELVNVMAIGAHCRCLVIIK
jgi:hypothetical protein